MMFGVPKNIHHPLGFISSTRTGRCWKLNLLNLDLATVSFGNIFHIPFFGVFGYRSALPRVKCLVLCLGHVVGRIFSVWIGGTKTDSTKNYPWRQS